MSLRDFFEKYFECLLMRFVMRSQMWSSCRGGQLFRGNFWNFLKYPKILKVQLFFLDSDWNFRNFRRFIGIIVKVFKNFNLFLESDSIFRSFQDFLNLLNKFLKISLFTVEFQEFSLNFQDFSNFDYFYYVFSNFQDKIKDFPIFRNFGKISCKI